MKKRTILYNRKLLARFTAPALVTELMCRGYRVSVQATLFAELGGTATRKKDVTLENFSDNELQLELAARGWDVELEIDQLSFDDLVPDWAS